MFIIGRLLPLSLCILVVHYRNVPSFSSQELLFDLHLLHPRFSHSPLSFGSFVQHSCKLYVVQGILSAPFWSARVLPADEQYVQLLRVLWVI